MDDLRGPRSRRNMWQIEISSQLPKWNRYLLVSEPDKEKDTIHGEVGHGSGFRCLKEDPPDLVQRTVWHEMGQCLRRGPRLAVLRLLKHPRNNNTMESTK